MAKLNPLGRLATLPIIQCNFGPGYVKRAIPVPYILRISAFCSFGDFIRMKLVLLVVAIVVAFMLLMLYRNFVEPAGLGVTDGQLAALPRTPNAVSSMTEEEARKVDVLPFTGSFEETKKHLLVVLQDTQDIEIEKDDGDYVHAIAITDTMKFRDDLEFLFDRENEIIHFRSASRVGYSDGGLNRKRYDQLRHAYLAK